MRQTELVVVENGVSGLPVVATLVSGLYVAELEAVDAQWSPVFGQLITDALNRGVSLYDLPEHKHWEWRRKARAMGAESRAFAIEMNHATQAVMIVRTDKVCRLPEQFGEPMVYVDYIATAPWNLPGMVAAPRYKKCGKRLVEAAIKFSIAVGFDGRVGLHSLEQAESFYISQFGMRDMGSDPRYEDLPYMEMTADTVLPVI